MNTDQKSKDHLYKQAFRNAKWILTDKESDEASEYNYLQMSEIVIDAYNKKKVKPENVTIKYLERSLCEIYRIDDKYGQTVSYSEILPDYTIDCYNWHYQCPECATVQPEIKKKGQKGIDGIYCLRCRKYYEYK